MSDSLYMIYWLIMPLVSLSGFIFAAWRWIGPIFGRADMAVPGLARASLVVLGNALFTRLLEHWQGGDLLGWQGLMIDVVSFIMIALPPRSYFQSALAAVFLVQVLVDAVSLIFTQMQLSGFAQPLWFAMIKLNYLQLVALLIWIGGSHAGVRAALADLRAGRVAGLSNPDMDKSAS